MTESRRTEVPKIQPPDDQNGASISSGAVEWMGRIAARSVASERCQFPAPMLRYMAASSSFAGRTKFGRLAGRSPGRSAESGSSL
jgi:hypothetical protein